jgi:hypothetical protein
MGSSELEIQGLKGAETKTTHRERKEGGDSEKASKTKV